MTRRHLTDDRLLSIALGEGPGPSDERHLGLCADCRAKQEALAGLLEEAAGALAREADDAFPDARLDRQRDRILQRVSVLSRPGRVITFPAASPGPSSPSASWRPSVRWVAAAALGGLLVGVMADQWVARRPGPPSRQGASQYAAPPVIQPVTASMSDDEFLGQLEAAVESGGPLMLRPLDAMTPLAWDVQR